LKFTLEIYWLLSEGLVSNYAKNSLMGLRLDYYDI
jgi:hypothetical protein